MFDHILSLRIAAAGGAADDRENGYARSD